MSMANTLGKLSIRDQAVVELVARFKQLTAAHIRTALFGELASQTPCDRVLKRLTESSHLARLARLVGGDTGGSSQFVYQLGRAGWKLLDKPGHYWAPRAVNLHTLAIADCFAALKQADQAGGLRLLTFTTEPDCHTSVGAVSLTPDAYVEVGDPVARLKRSFWLEIDQGTEHADKIRDKCLRYWQGYQRWNEAYYPSVVFVVPDARRRAQVERVIGGGPEEAQSSFVVATHAELLTNMAM
ncbi:replication-relaxation family protein [Actinokineospora guangxiensis]|uniref:Replication-relaxation family protein n=1 Tax=Actinokineospora guangxiensis TaxID=1490288 RepID=A0ABW0EXL5_9PSEU